MSFSKYARRSCEIHVSSISESSGGEKPSEMCDKGDSRGFLTSRKIISSLCSADRTYRQVLHHLNPKPRKPVMNNREIQSRSEESAGQTSHGRTFGRTLIEPGDEIHRRSRFEMRDDKKRVSGQGVRHFAAGRSL